jgi:hypothetical protein
MDNHTSDVPLKRCRSKDNCLHPNGPELPATTEYFYACSIVKCGLSGRCRKCLAEKSRLTAAANREKTRASAARYRANNRDKIREKDARHYAANRDRISARKSRYHREHPEKNHDRAVRYYAQHPEKLRAIVHRRRARQRNLPAARVSEKRARKYFNDCCAVCGRQRGLWHTIAMDHWIAIGDPRPDNPGHVPTNVVPLCHSKKGANGQGSCNNSKGNKDPIAWLIEQFGKRKAKEIAKRIQSYFDSL